MTDQPTNPLFGRQPNRPGRVTREMLDDLAARLNRSAFVIAQGWTYYVGQKFFDGQWKASLERRDGVSV